MLTDMALNFAHQDLQLIGLLGLGLRLHLALYSPRTLKKCITFAFASAQGEQWKWNSLRVLGGTLLGAVCWAVSVPR